MRSLEQELIHHAAPTLASLKAANLLGFRYEDEESLKLEVEDLRARLEQKGIRLRILKASKGHALIYIYRLRDLDVILSLEESQEILYRLGYFYMSTESAIDQLAERLFENDSFPHEIGLFLGYPICDVKGFLRDHGKNCTCEGLWKSYCDPVVAFQEFEKLEHCMRVYNRVYETGRTLLQLTVAS